MEKHEYCCQNAAQDYLDHVIPVPNDFNVNPSCLSGLSKEDFIGGLKALTEIIKSLYGDMVRNPAEYGLPLVEDIKYEKFNPKAADSAHSSRRLISLLHTLAQCGELSNTEILVNKKFYLEACKKLKPMYKISNGDMIFKKLCDFGFIVEGFNGKTFDKHSEFFTLSYPDDGRVVPALYGYMNNTPLKKHALFSLNYFLAIPENELPVNNHQMIFAEYLSGDEKKFYARFNEYIMADGLTMGVSDDYSNISFAVEYLIRPKDKTRLIACYSHNGKLRMRLRLRNIDGYADNLETLPERIKQLFRKESNCRFCQTPCGYQNSWRFEGKAYTVCGYDQYFDITCYNPADAEHYRQIIAYEVEAAKNKKR